MLFGIYCCYYFYFSFYKLSSYLIIFLLLVVSFFLVLALIYDYSVYFDLLIFDYIFNGVTWEDFTGEFTFIKSNKIIVFSDNKF